jgi:hypothetical protein
MSEGTADFDATVVRGLLAAGANVRARTAKRRDAANCSVENTSR